MDYILLTPADLTANRHDRLSQSQKPQLRRWRLLHLAGTVGLALLLFAIALLLLLKWHNPAFAARGQLFIVLPLLLFWLWLLRRQPRQWHQLGRDLRQGRVNHTEGTLYADFTPGLGLLRPLHYSIEVGEQRFRIDKQAFRRLRSGDRYRIYYTPHSATFLGALPLAPVPAATAEENAPAPTLPEPLTPREIEVLTLIAAGLSNQEIADQLHLSINTIKMYASQLYGKLGVGRRTEAVARARELDLL